MFLAFLLAIFPQLLSLQYDLYKIRYLQLYSKLHPMINLPHLIVFSLIQEYKEQDECHLCVQPLFHLIFLYLVYFSYTFLLYLVYLHLRKSTLALILIAYLHSQNHLDIKLVKFLLHSIYILMHPHNFHMSFQHVLLMGQNLYLKLHS